MLGARMAPGLTYAGWRMTAVGSREHLAQEWSSPPPCMACPASWLRWVLIKHQLLQQIAALACCKAAYNRLVLAGLLRISSSREERERLTEKTEGKAWWRGRRKRHPQPVWHSMAWSDPLWTLSCWGERTANSPLLQDWGRFKDKGSLSLATLGHGNESGNSSGSLSPVINNTTNNNELQ